MASQCEPGANSLELAEEAALFQRDASNKCSHEQKMPVVGIGASAGGLDALEKLFEAMPLDSGCAFIVVQHLAPQYPTHMDGILQRRTKMSIAIATQDVVIEPNTIYLGPPGQVVEVKGSTIHLEQVDRSAVPVTTIDRMFQSLASSHGKRAIAIVLSGSGSDGTQGLSYIREAGGTIIIQDNVSAQFQSMPQAANNAGLYDYILSPEEMPGAIGLIVNGDMLLDRADSEEVGNAGQIHNILQLLEDAYHVDFSQYKQSTIFRRIQRRVQLENCRSLIAYRDELIVDPDRLDLLYRDMLIGVTQFFRDSTQFKLLETQVLPQLIENCKERSEIRIWVTACASGEEAYSIGMLLDEQLAQLDRPLTMRMFATDVHPGALEVAGRGVYPAEAIADIPDERLQRYFVRKGDNYEVIPEFRKKILFSQHNLLRDPPFTQLDLVSCRNFLIYLDADTQDTAIARLHFGLRPEGVLFLGKSERVGRYDIEFEPITQEGRLYRKKRDTKLIKVGQTKLSSRLEGKRLTPAHSLSVPEVNLKAYEAIMSRLSYRGFLINEDGNIEHTFGDVGHLLDLSGLPKSNLFELVDRDLRLAIQTTLLRAKAAKAVQLSGTVEVKLSPDGSLANLKVQVEPMPPSTSGHRLFLVCLTAPLAPRDADRTQRTAVSESDQSEIDWLRNELKVAQESLERLMQEIGTRNEQLQASNQELTASNEELQSINEELQSVNEELHTINNEHQRSIDEMRSLAGDMEATFYASEIGVLFVDDQARIRNITTKMKEFFGLSDADLNHRIDDVGHGLGLDNVAELMNEALVIEAPVDRETRNRTGDKFLMRIVPDKARLGLLFMFVDVKQLNQRMTLSSTGSKAKRKTRKR